MSIAAKSAAARGDSGASLRDPRENQLTPEIKEKLIRLEIENQYVLSSFASRSQFSHFAPCSGLRCRQLREGLGDSRVAALMDELEVAKRTSKSNEVGAH